jgi:effector-binding domain-containing protein
MPTDDAITIVAREAQPVLETSAEARMWKIPGTLARGFGEVTSHIEKTGAGRAGMPFARYLEIDWQSVRKGAFGQLIDMLTRKQKMRMGLPVDRPVAGEGNVSAGEIAAGRYVTTIHRGAYHKVGATYRRILDWAEAEGATLSDTTIECYIDDPGEMPMEEVRTRILIKTAD